MKTIADYERGARRPYPRTIRDLREAFETAGIEFTNGETPGLRFKRGAAREELPGTRQKPRKVPLGPRRTSRRAKR